MCQRQCARLLKKGPNKLAKSKPLWCGSHPALYRLWSRRVVTGFFNKPRALVSHLPLRAVPIDKPIETRGLIWINVQPLEE